MTTPCGLCQRQLSAPELFEAHTNCEDRISWYRFRCPSCGSYTDALEGVGVRPLNGYWPFFTRKERVG